MYLFIWLIINKKLKWILHSSHCVLFPSTWIMSNLRGRLVHKVKTNFALSVHSFLASSIHSPLLQLFHVCTPSSYPSILQMAFISSYDPQFHSYTFFTNSSFYFIWSISVSKLFAIEEEIWDQKLWHFLFFLHQKDTGQRKTKTLNARPYKEDSRRNKIRGGVHLTLEVSWHSSYERVKS